MISNNSIYTHILKFFALDKRQFGKVDQMVIETQWADFSAITGGVWKFKVVREFSV